MSTTMLNFQLPEFVFLDGNNPLGDTLEHRTVVQHIRSYTIMEVLALDEIGALGLKDNTKSFEFEYTNIYNKTERHMLVVHFTLADEDDSEQLHEIFQKTARWYCDYLRWEDGNIKGDKIATAN